MVFFRWGNAIPHAFGRFAFLAVFTIRASRFSPFLLSFAYLPLMKVEDLPNAVDLLFFMWNGPGFGFSETS